MARQAAVEQEKAAPRTRAAKKMEEGENYICAECGLTVEVVAPCGCEPEVCYLTCCERPMQKATRTRTTRKTTARAQAAKK